MALPPGYKKPIVGERRDALVAKAESGDALEAIELASIMIIGIEDALENGTKHYDKDGNLLKHPKEIINALTRDKLMREMPNCPICGAEGFDLDYDEVDIGVGTLEGNFRGVCKNCGQICECSDCCRWVSEEQPACDCKETNA